MTSRHGRAARALIASIVIVGLTTGAVGFVAAGQPDADVPDTLTVPKPRSGDRGRYTLTTVEVDDGRTRIVDEEHPYVSFTWRTPASIRNRTGQPVTVNRLQLDIHNRQAFPTLVTDWDHGWPNGSQATVLLEAGSNRWVATQSRETTQWVEHTGISSTVRHVEGTFYPTEIPMTQRFGFLGLHNGLQGRTTDLDGSVFDEAVPMFTGTTNRLTSDAPIRVYGYEPLSAGAIGGHDAVAFGADSASVDPGGVNEDEGGIFWPRTFVWMTPDIPYPLKIAVERSPNVFDVVRLQGFDRGDEPLASQPDEAQMEDAPDLVYADRTFTGPAKGDLAHPFPISEAFQRARDNPLNASLRAFLADHPDAFVGDAYYHQDHVETDGGRTVERTWDLSVVTPQWTAMTVEVTQQTAEGPTGGLPVPDQAPVDAAYEYSYGPTDAWRGLPILIPGGQVRLPERLPTVASMADRWRAYASPEHASATDIGWSFRVTSPTSEQAYDVPRLSVVTSVGRIDAGQSAGPDDGLGEDAAVSVAAFDDAGQTLYVQEATEETQIVGEPDNDVDHGSRAVTAAEVTVPVWAVPPLGWMAGAGLLGAVAAAVYYFWPAIRHLPLIRGYTRIQAEEALENPNRAAIVETVRNRPGIHLKELVRRSEMGHGAVRHHVEMLTELDHLVETRSDGYRCYFAPGEVARNVREAIPLVKADGARRILRVVAETPGLAGQDVAERTDLSTATVNYHLKRLRDAGLVDADRDGRSLSLSVTTLGQAVLETVAGNADQDADAFE